jgi:hypothetical protein
MIMNDKIEEINKKIKKLEWEIVITKLIVCLLSINLLCILHFL